MRELPQARRRTAQPGNRALSWSSLPCGRPSGGRRRPATAARDDAGQRAPSAARGGDDEHLPRARKGEQHDPTALDAVVGGYQPRLVGPRGDGDRDAGQAGAVEKEIVGGRLWQPWIEARWVAAEDRRRMPVDDGAPALLALPATTRCREAQLCDSRRRANRGQLDRAGALEWREAGSVPPYSGCVTIGRPQLHGPPDRGDRTQHAPCSGDLSVSSRGFRLLASLSPARRRRAEPVHRSGQCRCRRASGRPG